MVGSAAAAAALVGVLRCEPPNPNLHYFAGRFTYREPDGPRCICCCPCNLGESDGNPPKMHVRQAYAGL